MSDMSTLSVLTLSRDLNSFIYYNRLINTDIDGKIVRINVYSNIKST